MQSRGATSDLVSRAQRHSLSELDKCLRELYVTMPRRKMARINFKTLDVDFDWGYGMRDE